MFILLLKDGVAVATAVCKNLEENSENLKLYDSVVEVDEQTFESIELPAVLRNGVWEKTAKAPAVEYPPIKEENSNKETVYDELAAAYRKGVQEA